MARVLCILMPQSCRAATKRQFSPKAWIPKTQSEAIPPRGCPLQVPNLCVLFVLDILSVI